MLCSMCSFKDDLSNQIVINKTRASGIVIDANWFNGVSALRSILRKSDQKDLHFARQHGYLPNSRPKLW